MSCLLCRNGKTTSLTVFKHFLDIYEATELWTMKTYLESTAYLGSVYESMLASYSL